MKYQGLFEAVASAASEEVARRAGWALIGLAGTEPADHVPALRHPAARVLQLRGRPRCRTRGS